MSETKIGVDVVQGKEPSAEETLQHIVAACADAKGKDITILDVSKIFDMASYFVIVTARSDRQAQGISNRVLDNLYEHKIDPYSVDGLEAGHWVLMDYGDVVLHVFYEPVREYYNLEGLWAAAIKIEPEPMIIAEREAA